MDQSLDDIIASEKATLKATRGSSAAAAAAVRGRGRGGRASRGRGGGRGRGAPIGYMRPAPYIKRVVADDDYQYDHEEPEPAEVKVAPASVSLHTGSKLFISNLDAGVTTEDIEELYGKFGDLKRAHVHYDQGGRSLGTAEVTYFKRQNAVQAMTEYNNVSLDGQPMVIESITKAATAQQQQQPPPQQQPILQQPVRQQPRQYFPDQGRGAPMRANYVQEPYAPRERLRPQSIRPRGGGRGSRGRGGDGRGRGGGRGGGRDTNPKVSQEDLDKEMENYMAKATASK